MLLRHTQMHYAADRCLKRVVQGGKARSEGGAGRMRFRRVSCGRAERISAAGITPGEMRLRLWREGKRGR